MTTSSQGRCLPLTGGDVEEADSCLSLVVWGCVRVSGPYQPSGSLLRSRIIRCCGVTLVPCQTGRWVETPEEREDQALARRRSWDGSAEAPGRSVLRSGSQPFPASHPRPWSVECDCGRRGCARAVAAHCCRVISVFLEAQEGCVFPWDSYTGDTCCGPFRYWLPD